jgi:FkbM family methyltransferase
MKRQLAKLVLRCYPFYSGYYKVVSSPLGQWLGTAAQSGQIVRTRARGGIRLEVRLDDVEGHCIDLLGDWDPRITWICRRVLRPGDTFVDVGANFGLVSLIGARAVGSTGRVHAFESQPALAAMLRRSAALNHLANLTLHEVALSDRDGVLELQVPCHHSGGASLIRKDTGQGLRCRSRFDGARRISKHTGIGFSHTFDTAGEFLSAVDRPGHGQDRESWGGQDHGPGRVGRIRQQYHF